MTSGEENCGGGHVFVCSHAGCNAVFKRKDRLKHHLNTHDGNAPYKCSYESCTRAYSNPAGLKRHVKQCHQSQGYKRSYSCTHEGCSKVFKSSTSFARHMKHIHQGRAYQCSHCPKSFKKHQQLKIHEFEHTGVKPFKCTYESCEKSFLLPSKLKAHKKLHKGYNCTWAECEQKFDKWTLLQKHIKLEHVQVHKCSSCNKTFSTKSNLLVHSKTHNSTRELFLCTYDGCPRFYFFEKNLQHHINSTHEGKKLSCPHDGCSKEFKHRVTMRKHMKLHDPQAPLQPKKKRKCRKRRSLAAHLSGHKPSKAEELEILCKDDSSTSGENKPSALDEGRKIEFVISSQPVINESNSSDHISSSRRITSISYDGCSSDITANLSVKG